MNTNDIISMLITALSGQGNPTFGTLGGLTPIWQSSIADPKTGGLQTPQNRFNVGSAFPGQTFRFDAASNQYAPLTNQQSLLNMLSGLLQPTPGVRIERNPVTRAVQPTFTPTVDTYEPTLENPPVAQPPVAPSRPTRPVPMIQVLPGVSVPINLSGLPVNSDRYMPARTTPNQMGASVQRFY